MHRDSHILHRQLRGRYPLAARAEGCFIEDAEGRRYLDASGGAAVSCLGHGHPDVLAAMHAQIDRVAYAHTSFFTTDGRRAARRPAGRTTRRPALSHAYFVSGGSEAMEAALKMARQYFVETGQPQRQTSSPAARATTATRSARWRSAATSGGGASSRRC